MTRPRPHDKVQRTVRKKTSINDQDGGKKNKVRGRNAADFEPFFRRKSPTDFSNGSVFDDHAAKKAQPMPKKVAADTLRAMEHAPTCWYVQHYLTHKTNEKPRPSVML